jgi:quinol monooxygenase YgiN
MTVIEYERIFEESARRLVLIRPRVEELQVEIIFIWASLVKSNLLKRTSFTRPSRLQNSSSEPTPFYFWTGTYTAVPGKRAEVVSILSDFSSVVEQTEPDTLSYIVFLSTNDVDEDTIYLWEKYVNESGLRDVHMRSDAASKLKDQIGPLLNDRSMAGYHQIYFERS